MLLASCTHKSAEDRFIDELMSVMTLDEKIGQLNLPVGGDVVSGNGAAAPLDSLIVSGRVGGVFNVTGVDEISRLQHLAVEHSPHGIPLLVGADVVHGYKTIFPIPLALSCTWDSTAVERMARISAIEATADGVNWNYSPMVDICRDPRWGRIAEGAGEDPYLGSVMARAYVRGYQGNDMRDNSTLMACVKHFALYGAVEAGRDYNTVDMSREKMFNYYLPPFRAVVGQGVGSLMTSFNLVNGRHATSSAWLVDGVLRRRWGFDGLVVTDYNSIPDIAITGCASEADAAAMTLAAGTDMDMVSGLYLNTLRDALARGLVTAKMIDDACRRVLRAKYRLGLFDAPYKYWQRRGRETIFSLRHTARRLGKSQLRHSCCSKTATLCFRLKRKARLPLSARWPTPPAICADAGARCMMTRCTNRFLTLCKMPWAIRPGYCMRRDAICIMMTHSSATPRATNPSLAAMTACCTAMPLRWRRRPMSL